MLFLSHSRDEGVVDLTVMVAVAVAVVGAAGKGFDVG